MTKLSMIISETRNGVWVKEPSPSWPQKALEAYCTLADEVAKRDLDGAFVEFASPDEILEEFRHELEERGCKAAVRAIVVDAEAPQPVVSLTVTETCGAYAEYGGAWSVLDVSSLFATTRVQRVLSKFAKEFADHEKLPDGGNRFFGLQGFGDVSVISLADSLRAAGAVVAEDCVDAEEDKTAVEA